MIGRNDPCWCESGKKYKKCHLRSDEEEKKNPDSAPASKRIAAFTSGMRAAGAFNGQVMDYVRPYVKAGVSTMELNNLIHSYTVEHGHVPACLGYRGYPNG